MLEMFSYSNMTVPWKCWRGFFSLHSALHISKDWIVKPRIQESLGRKHICYEPKSVHCWKYFLRKSGKICGKSHEFLINHHESFWRQKRGKTWRKSRQTIAPLWEQEIKCKRGVNNLIISQWSVLPVDVNIEEWNLLTHLSVFLFSLNSKKCKEKMLLGWSLIGTAVFSELTLMRAREALTCCCLSALKRYRHHSGAITIKSSSLIQTMTAENCMVAICGSAAWSHSV